MKERIRFPWIAFDNWTHSAGSVFIRDRWWLHGYKWTPFVWVKFRYV